MKKLILTIGCFDHAKASIHPGIFSANLLTILFAATIILFPLKANSGVPPCNNVSGDIEFVGTNNGSEVFSFSCGGPWLRSGEQQIPFCAPGFPPCTCTFYAANITLFSPYGLWTCNVGGGIATADFCVEKGDTKVNLVFDSSGGSDFLMVDKPPPLAILRYHHSSVTTPSRRNRSPIPMSSCSMVQAEMK